jgi:hypothetical protein
MLSSCKQQRTVTKYDENGKPYSAQEDDWLGTLAVVVLVLLLVGIVAGVSASNKKDDGSSMNWDPKDPLPEGAKIHHQYTLARRVGSIHVVWGGRDFGRVNLVAKGRAALALLEVIPEGAPITLTREEILDIAGDRRALLKPLSLEHRKISASIAGTSTDKVVSFQLS